MIFLIYLPLDLDPYQIALLDVLMLIVISAPIIYTWIVKPYVAEHDEFLDQIQYLINHDPLTHSANRRLLLEFLENMISRLTRYHSFGALLYIDLDGFKAINDNHGHEAGDAILIESVNRLKSIVRAGDIVSRVGGDEFIVVLDQLGTDQKTANNRALTTTGRIIKLLSEPIDFKGVTCQVSSSIGVRFMTVEDTNPEELIRDADTAMYSAKQTGNGSISIFQNCNLEPVLLKTG